MWRFLVNHKVFATGQIDPVRAAFNTSPHLLELEPFSTG
jgi:hypothetical protein